MVDLDGGKYHVGPAKNHWDFPSGFHEGQELGSLHKHEQTVWWYLPTVHCEPKIY